MNQQSTQKPSLGCVVLFSQASDSYLARRDVKPGRYAADIVKVEEETGHIFLHVKTLDDRCPIVVVTASITPEVVDVWGRSWCWPPRV